MTSGACAMDKVKVILVSFNWSNHFSLANGYLKAYAEKDKFIRNNVLIRVVDFDAEQHNVQQALYYLSKEKPDIVGFSCYCWNMDKILDISRLLKQLYPEIKIIFGGPEVGAAAHKYMMENPAVDVIVRGEGEATFRELLGAYSGVDEYLSGVAGVILGSGRVTGICKGDYLSRKWQDSEHRREAPSKRFGRYTIALLNRNFDPQR